jgi:hypothetical protein
MNTIYIYLDDIRDPPTDGNAWRVARSVPLLQQMIGEMVETGEMLSATKVIFSLDHDLGENQPTGYDFLKMIEETVYHMGSPKGQDLEFHIHSANPVGRANMTQAILSINKMISQLRSSND